MLKISLIALLCVVALSLAQTTDDVKREERVFNQWLKKHNLDATPDADFAKWKKEVIRKFKDIEAHNAKYRKGEVKFRKALNHLSHLTPEERRATVMGFETKPDEPSQDKFVATITDPEVLKNLPDYWNWNDHGVVHAVQNQGSCSDCYIFATIGAIESHACIYGDSCDKLSEQEALDCNNGNKCKAGKPEMVYNYTIRNGGGTYAKDYPYTAVPVECKADSRKRVPKTKVIDWKFMPNSAQTIQYYLYNIGPMFMAMKFYDSMGDYDGGIIDEVSGDYGGHALLLTGYGTENGTDYWIIKNSWGPTYGENGYFRLKRGINLANCEAQWPNYPVLELL